MHWYRIKNVPQKHSLNNLHGERFCDAFDGEFDLMFPEIVGLMMRLYRYGGSNEKYKEADIQGVAPGTPQYNKT